MKVRCPACQTTFRLQIAQLEAHAGMVRCGHCYTPFNAREHFVEPPPSPPAEEASFQLAEPTFQFTPEVAEEPPPRAPEDQALRFSVPERPLVRSTPTATPTTTPPRAPASWPRLHAEPEPGADDVLPDFSLPPSPFRRRSTNTASIPAAFAEAPTEPPLELQAPRPLSAAPTQTSVTDTATVQDAEKQSPTTPEPQPEHAQPEATPDADDESRKEPRIATGPDTEPDATPPLRATGDDETQPADDEAPHYLYKPVDPPASALSRWVHGILLGLLLGMLLVQSAYLYRTELIRDWPELRPLFQQVCSHFGCELPLPRMAALITIETSDLQSEPNQPGHYVLNALIRNQAQHAQTYPHLELTLTDARDQALARRVLPPTEWLPPETDLEEGFTGRSAQSLRLKFETHSLGTASGYRLYAFYP